MTPPKEPAVSAYLEILEQKRAMKRRLWSLVYQDPQKVVTYYEHHYEADCELMDDDTKDELTRVYKTAKLAIKARQKK